MVLTADKIRHWKKAAQQDLPYHSRQFEEPYRSTKHLAQFIRSLVPAPEGEALDVACGAGANIYYLSQLFTGCRWTGIDIVGDVLFPLGHAKFIERNLDVTLIDGDFYRLTEIFPDKQFDLVLSLQTLLALPSYEMALEQLLAVTRGWLFITSLFTDFNVDAKIEVMDYSWPEGTQGPYYYSVWSLSRFRSFCEKRGCQKFISRDFELDIDLPPPETMGFRTFTKTLADGRRLQFTGPLLMPWKFVGIRMRDA
jgi:SAM-dependent methyltransferase